MLTAGLVFLAKSVISERLKNAIETEYAQKLGMAGLHMLGLYGQLEPGSTYARLAGGFARSYVTSVGATIAAGTSEIQRSIIATRGLGLPRG